MAVCHWQDYRALLVQLSQIVSRRIM